MRKLATAMVVGLGVLALAATAMAQDSVAYKKRTIIDLSGAVIEGELTKPEGSYVVSRKLSKFSALIQARGNYLPELLNSFNEL